MREKIARIAMINHAYFYRIIFKKNDYFLTKKNHRTDHKINAMEKRRVVMKPSLDGHKGKNPLNPRF